MISIIIPAYNEQDAIVETIEKSRACLPQSEFGPVEVIVVDDCSTDKTAGLAQKTGVKVISHPQNSGYGRSLKDGILAAKYDTIVITDADGTYPLDQIPVLIKECRKGFDMVIGARQGKKFDPTLIQRILRTALKWLVEFTTGRVIPDINSGLRVFSKKEAIKFFPHLSNAFSFTTSLTLAYMLTGKFVTFIPIEFHERIGKAKVRLARDMFRTLQYITEAILYYNPIKLFLVYCGILFLLSVLSFLVYLFSNVVYLFQLSKVLLLLSLIVFPLGLLSIQLKQILHSLSHERKDP